MVAAKAPKIYLGPDWQANPIAMRLIRRQAKSRHLSVDRYLRELIAESLLAREAEELRAAEPPQSVNPAARRRR